jgi:hypothetical protein
VCKPEPPLAGRARQHTGPEEEDDDEEEERREGRRRGETGAVGVEESGDFDASSEIGEIDRRLNALQDFLKQAKNGEWVGR